VIALTCASEVIFKIGERSCSTYISRVYTFNCDDGVCGKAHYIKTFHSIMFFAGDVGGPLTWVSRSRDTYKSNISKTVRFGDKVTKEH